MYRHLLAVGASRSRIGTQGRWGEQGKEADVSEGSSLILDPQVEPVRTCCWLRLLLPLPILGLLNQRQCLGWGTWVVLGSKYKKGTNLTLLPSTAHARPAIIWLPGSRMVSQAVACHGEIPKRKKR